MEFNFSDWEIVKNGHHGRRPNESLDKVRIVQNKGNSVVFYFYKLTQTALSLVKGVRYQLALKPELNAAALIKKESGNLLTRNSTDKSDVLHISFIKKCFFANCVEVPLENIETDAGGNIVFYLSGKPKKEQTATDQKLAKIKAIASVTLETIINVLKDKKGGAPETFIKTETIKRLKNNGDEVVGALYIQELLESNTGSLFNMVEFGKNNRYFSLKG